MMSWRDQFAKPTGALGQLAGYVMAMKNGERSEYVFSILDLRPVDDVLEIGFGPGTDIARASKIVTLVAGIDHSEVMLAQASRRNAQAIRDGKVELQLGVAAKLPYPDERFDRVYAINSAQFWKDAVKTMVEIRRVLKPRGFVVLAVQPRNKGATEETAKQAGYGLAKSLTAAGFGDVHCESRPMKPVATACVIARR